MVEETAGHGVKEYEAVAAWIAAGMASAIALAGIFYGCV